MITSGNTIKIWLIVLYAVNTADNAADEAAKNVKRTDFCLSDTDLL